MCEDGSTFGVESENESEYVPDNPAAFYALIAEWKQIGEVDFDGLLALASKYYVHGVPARDAEALGILL